MVQTERIPLLAAAADIISHQCSHSKAIEAEALCCHPVCLVQMERRDRLRKIMAAADEETLADAFEALVPAGALRDAVPFKEIFYTEGTPALLDARLQVRCPHPPRRVPCQPAVRLKAS